MENLEKQKIYKRRKKGKSENIFIISGEMPQNFVSFKIFGKKLLKTYEFRKKDAKI
jgi:hypothetical protein